MVLGFAGIDSQLIIDTIDTGYSYDESDNLAACHETPTYIQTDDMPESTIELLLKRSQSDLVNFNNGKKTLWNYDRYDINFAFKLNEKVLSESQNRYVAVLNELSELGNKYDFSIHVLIQPSEYDMTTNHPVNHKSLLEYSVKNNIYYDRFYLSNLFDFNEKRTDIDFVNLSPQFLDCNKCYFNISEYGDDNHWNALGIQVAMEKVAGRIEITRKTKEKKSHYMM